MLKQILIILCCLLPAFIFAQDTNSLHKQKDSIHTGSKIILVNDTVHRDSLKNATIVTRMPQNDSLLHDSASRVILDSTAFLQDSLKKDSLLKVQVAKKSIPKTPPVILMPGSEREAGDGDVTFFVLIFLVFFFGLVKTAFPKYINSIYSLSFQATFRQTQTKEQMAQNFIPALMLNVLFVLSGGLFIALFAARDGLSQLKFWQLFIFSTSILLIVYLVKYIVISFIGWVFNAKEVALEYRFIVFLINKLLAILLLPLLFLIAYASRDIQSIAITIVMCLIAFSLATRYLVSLSRIRKNLNLSAFHFFIYLCAVEIMPLLVIYKILFQQTSNS